MKQRDFETWVSEFRPSISGYRYYVDFDKVVEHVDKLRMELALFNTMIGSEHIEETFEAMVTEYPETLKCIPLLLAVRQDSIYAQDEEGAVLYDFSKPNVSLEQYKKFMRKTGLFGLLERRLIHNMADYVLGVETGLDSNARKNRGGRQMEDLVEEFIRKTGAIYYKEMYLSEIEEKWSLDLSSLSNNGKARKRFDFVVWTQTVIYGIETNFYGGTGGSKLNETARSYKMLAKEAEQAEGFSFLWITDGTGWIGSKGNLREAFDAMEHIYNLADLENGVLEQLFCGRLSRKEQKQN